MCWKNGICSQWDWITKKGQFQDTDPIDTRGAQRIAPDIMVTIISNRWLHSTCENTVTITDGYERKVAILCAKTCQDCLEQVSECHHAWAPSAPNDPGLWRCSHRFDLTLLIWNSLLSIHWCLSSPPVFKSDEVGWLLQHYYLLPPPTMIVSWFRFMGGLLSRLFASGVEARGVECVPKDQCETKNTWNKYMNWSQAFSGIEHDTPPWTVC